MGFVRFEDMNRPPRPYRVDLDTRREDGEPNFRTFRQELGEDEERVRLMLQSIRRCPERFGEEAIDLLNRLTEGVAAHVAPPTLASSLYMRECRIRVIGHLWRLAENQSLTPAVTATLRPTGMWFPIEKLMNIDPHALLRRLRVDLDRLGFAKMQGYLLAQLHSEFDPNRGGSHFHYHLVAGGEIALALDLLKSIRRFDPCRIEPHELLMRDRRRVVISRQPLTNVPDPLLYHGLQSWHPQHVTHLAADGLLDRDNRTRMREPYHTAWLLWMDRIQLSDLIFCVGMRPTKSGFRLNAR